MSDDLHTQALKRVGAVARKWTLDSLIDVGGMAAVYAATHRNGNRVAIKVLHRSFAQMEQAKDRFLREGYVANKVGHDGAVTVLDDDVLDDGTPFIVMELLLGQSLEGRLAKRRVLSPTETLYVVDQVLAVLGAAHEMGIVHRDIKPPNVFLTTDGTVKVLDFGLARVFDADQQMSMTKTGMLIGTPSYMSPEQAVGRPELVDHRTDLFAVGALAFRALAGRNVHNANTPMDMLIAAASKRAPSLSEVVRGAPYSLVQLVDTALAFEKEQRFPDAASMQHALRTAYEDLQVGYQPAAPARPTAAGDSLSVVVGPTGESIAIDLDEDGEDLDGIPEVSVMLADDD